MNSMHYIGFDIHKKVISFCEKLMDGTIVDQGVIPAVALYAPGHNLLRVSWHGESGNPSETYRSVPCVPQSFQNGTFIDGLDV